MCDSSSVVSFFNQQETGEVSVLQSCLRKNWSKCGFGYVEYLAPALLWGLWFLLTVGFSWYAGIWEELNTSIEDLHDMQSQALGLIVSRQRTVLFGKKIYDPRRFFMLLSMWIEIPGFSFVPCSLLYKGVIFPHKNLLFNFDGRIEVFKVILCCAIMYIIIILKLFENKITKFLKSKILSPILFDVTFLLFMSSIDRVGTCSYGVEQFILPDKSSCACVDRFWIFHALCIVAFACLYCSALYFKISMNDELYSVQFRYQTSFNTIMTATRTVCSLLDVTASIMLDNVRTSTVFIIIGAVNFTIMSFLLHHNFRFQPCLGTGRFPNNLRSISFSSACASSLCLIISGVGLAFSNDSIISFIRWIFPAFIISVWFISWKINSMRSNLYHIPSLSLTESLGHSNSRVQTVAAISITIESDVIYDGSLTKKWLKILQRNLTLSNFIQEGLLIVYTCRAIWRLHLLYLNGKHHLKENLPKSDSLFHKYAAFGLWTRYSMNSLGTLKATVQARSRLRILADRSSQIESISSSTNLPKIVASEDTWIHILRRQVLEKAIEMLNIPYVRARSSSAKFLYDLYIAELVQISLRTFIIMTCCLCEQSDKQLTHSAILTLDNLIKNTNLSADTKYYLFGRVQLIGLSTMLLDKGLAQKLIVEKVASLLVFVIQSPVNENLLSVVSSELIENLTKAWKIWHGDFRVAVLLEDIIMSIIMSQPNVVLPRCKKSSLFKSSTPSKKGFSTLLKLRPKANIVVAPSPISIGGDKIVNTSKRKNASINLRDRNSLVKTNRQSMFVRFFSLSPDQREIRNFECMFAYHIVDEILQRRHQREEVYAYIQEVFEEGLARKVSFQNLSVASQKNLKEVFTIMNQSDMIDEFLKYGIFGPESSYILFLKNSYY